MGFIALAQGVIFDTTHEEGQLFHTDNGQCLALDPIATMLLQSGLEHTTKNEAIADLLTSIEASNQQLEDGFQIVIQQLRSYNFLGSEQQAAILPSVMPELQQDEHVADCSNTETLFSKLKGFSGERASWEVFLTGTLINEPLPTLTLSCRMYALANVMVIFLVLGGYRLTKHVFAMFHFRKQVFSIQQWEWKSICHSLSAISAWPSHLYTSLESEMIERIARRELIFCQFAVRLSAPMAMCLVRSVAFCAYLRAVGLPAQLVIGRERFCLSDDDAFHAWVELSGHVVNDHDEVQSGYTVMHRVPSNDSYMRSLGNAHVIHQNRTCL